MVQALLNSIKGMLSRQTSQNNDFKNEALRNNKNISSTIRDIAKHFSTQASISQQQNVSLDSIESHTQATSFKVDQSHRLLQEPISIQSQLLGEMKNLSSSMNQLLSSGGSGADQRNSGSFAQRALGGALTALGVAGAGLGAGAGLLNNFFGDQTGDPNTFSDSNVSGASYSPSGDGVGSSENAQKALDFFKSKGWTDAQAAGIVGNLQAESGKNLAPHGKPGDGGKARGIAQWHPDRRGNFQNAIGKPFDESSFEDQLNFIQWELENTEARAAQKLRQAKSASEAAAIFDQYYERSSGEHRQKRINNANSLLPEGDETGASSGSKTQPRDSATGSGGNVYERQKELAGIRKLPLSQNLKNVLQQAAAAAGVDVVVYSGGQAAKGKGGPRTGSTRHDNGNAADLYLMRNGKKLSDTNKEDRAIMAKFVSAAVSAGATGVGAGHGYMGSSNIHVGFGKQATWGGAPWIKAAASGVYSNQDLSAQGGESYAGGAGGEGSTGGGGVSDSLGQLSAAISALGGGSMMGGNIMSMLSGFFGIPMGQMFGESAISAYNAGSGSEGKGHGYIPKETSEKEPDETDNPGRSRGRGGPDPNDPEYKNYLNSLGQKSSTNFLPNNENNIPELIQTAAVETNTIRSFPNNIPPQTGDPSVTQDLNNTNTNTSGSKDHRAPWASRFAVLVPDDIQVELSTTPKWAARHGIA